ncbi:MAG: fasciclin domain-containing protein [bacterium]
MDYYYKNDESTVDQTIWELVSAEADYSIFVDYIKQAGLDSLFTSGKSLTLIIPSNDAFTDFKEDSVAMELLLSYHLIETVVNIRNITDSRKIESASGKYLLFEMHDQNYYIDGVNVSYTSPLCLDGRFYVVNEVLYPKPTIYEYIADNNPVMKKYIDQFDSVYLDVNESTPIAYDEEGNTIYDSVFSFINMFDSLYFPVDQEYRNRGATMILVDAEDYYPALDVMADNMQGFTSHEDIPDEWQLNVLIPHIINNGFFQNILNYEDFLIGDMKNIIGDSISVDYTQIDPNSRTIVSNGVLYKYLNYSVPDSLYSGEIRLQGESLLEPIGEGVYSWADGVIVTGTSALPRKASALDVADNDTILQLELGRKYEGSFEMSFKIPDVLPQRYRLVIRSNYRPAGEYEIYVNNELIGTVDLFGLRRTGISVTGELFVPEKGFNFADFWVENLTEYGDALITFKFIGSGTAPISQMNGLSLDYISLISVNE